MACVLRYNYKHVVLTQYEQQRTSNLNLEKDIHISNLSKSVVVIVHTLIY